MPMTHRGETTPTQLHFENQNIAEPWPLMVLVFVLVLVVRGVLRLLFYFVVFFSPECVPADISHLNYGSFEKGNTTRFPDLNGLQPETAIKPLCSTEPQVPCDVHVYVRYFCC